MNIWGEAKEIIGTVAPSLAALLGGPLAGTAVGEIVKVLGLAPNASPADVTEALKTATPEELIELKKADEAFQVQLKQIDIEWDKLVYDDMANARGRQTAEHDPVPAWMGSGIVGAFVVMVVLLLLGYGKADTALMGTLVGYMSAKAEQVVAYYFGSSSGSRSKDAMLYASTPAQPTPKVPASEA